MAIFLILGVAFILTLVVLGLFAAGFLVVAYIFSKKLEKISAEPARKKRFYKRRRA